MKEIITLVFLLVSCATFAQFDPDRNDFFEVSGVLGTLASDQIKPDEQGRTFEVQEAIYQRGLGLRYGKSFLPFAHLVLGFDYARRDQISVADYGDNIEKPFTYYTSTSRYHTMMLQLGLQLAVIKSEKIDFSLGGGGFAREASDQLFRPLTGFYSKLALGYNFSQRNQINLKYGYESTVGNLISRSFPLEISLHYKIY